MPSGPDPGSADPFEQLGLPRSASVADIRAARRRLARNLHPDVGGDATAMRDLNAAVDAAVAHATGRRRLSDASSGTSRPPDARRDHARRPTVGWSDTSGRPQIDEWSFTVEALPAEAFEMLIVVTSWVGDVLVDDPPYLLEVHLREPAPCWCRLTLVPDAGSSTVSLVVASVEPGAAAPSIEAVRDMWVANLNRL